MNATLYTGNGGTQTITNGVSGQSFQPDLVWIKGRSSSNQDHTLVDSVRGVSRRIRSNATTAEVLESGFNVTAFNSSGFTAVDDAAGDYNVNGSVGGTYSGAAQYVGWQWKAGGTAVSNTNGTITSSVSANTTSGFSIVSWTQGSSTSQTIGHGLGVAPAMFIVKDRTATSSWYVYHQSIGATGGLSLNSTSATTTSANFWNNTAPTSSVMTISTNCIGTAGDALITYCWTPIAGYSAFGSYTGNGSADGPFVYTGFRPRYVLLKRTDSSGNWGVWDTSRDPYNAVQYELVPNLSDAETTAAGPRLDILSNGFKLRNTGAAYNASGGTYVYACFAENPFKYANAR
jgi:hypothetical protein